MEERKRTILVVDDDESTRQQLDIVLKKIDVNVEMAENGIECIDKMSGHFPDLLIVDYMMPEKNGLQVLEDLQHLEGVENLSIIMLTAKGERDVVEESARYGVSDFIVKPIELKFFLDRISSYIPDFGISDLIMMLGTMEKASESVYNIPKIQRAAGDKFDAYIFAYDDKRYISLVANHLLPTDLLNPEMDEIKKNVRLYYKSPTQWIRVWPSVSDLVSTNI